MRRISAINAKGGVGKSTVLLNLAHALAQRGRRVLLLDTDLQGNAASVFVPDDHEGWTLYDVLYGAASIPQAAIEGRPGLWVVPSDPKLDQAAKWLVSQPAGGLNVLHRALAGLDERFDYLLVDHSPNFTSISEAALRASREMLVPVVLEPFAMQGVRAMMERLEEWQILVEHELTICMVVPVNVDRRFGETMPYLATLANLFGGLLAEPIRTDAEFVHAQGRGQTVLEYAPRSKGADDIRALADRLEGVVAEEVDVDAG